MTLFVEKVPLSELGETRDPWSMPNFATLIDTAHGAIGRVVASEKEPSGSHVFYFWIGESQLSLDVGHIVVGFSEESAVIGVVDQPRRYSDLRTFLDDFYDRHLEEAIELEPPTRRPEILVFEVHVLRTKHLRDDVVSQRPVIAGPVYFATRAAIDYALGVWDFDGVPIPALLHTNGNAERSESGEIVRDELGYPVFQRSPLWLDEKYLLGPEAGHANWTGQSGLATKTSHALFLISAVFQRLAREQRSVAALLFNVKGPDLIWLDKPAAAPEGLEASYDSAGHRGFDARDYRAYQELSLEPKPFADLRLFAPFKPGMAPAGAVAALASTAYHDKLNTLRTALGERDTVFPILWGLDRLLRYPHRVFEHGDLDDKMWGLISDLRAQGATRSSRSVDARLSEMLDRIAAEQRSDWDGHHKATILKAQNRFRGLPSKFNGLLAEGEVDYGNLARVDAIFGDQEVRVVDIAHCNTNVQELLVSSIIESVWRMAEDQKLGVDKLIVFVDELNKYAPAGGEGGLRDTLVDIAARGRHLNVVLFGAQQFRSKVETEILGNCGTSFYGRVGDEEIINSSYRSLSETTRSELLGLQKGRMLVRHAHFRAPLFGVFPRPPVIPGMSGQRVFNGEQNAGTQTSLPADMIFRLCQRYMGSDAPSQGEVRSVAGDLPADKIESITQQVEQNYRNRIEGKSAARKVTIWSMVKNALTDTRQSMRRY
ncbi:ATP-binding protein [soil metagenome]